MRSALPSYPYGLEHLGSPMSGILLALSYCFPGSVEAGTAVESVLGLDIVYLGFLKHNLILFPNSDIPVWSMPDEITFCCCPVFVLVGCTPELSFPTTSNNLYLCFPKATVRSCPGCRGSSQRDFIVKRGLYACHGSEKRIGIGTFRAEV